MSGSTPLNEMDCIEWSWDREFFSLHVNTRMNIHTIDVNLHCWFDLTKDKKPIGWFWIPTKQNSNLIVTIHAFYVGIPAASATAGRTANARKDPNSFYDNTTKFEYRLIPLPNMNESGSVRRYKGDLFGSFNPALVEHSVYPFKTFPDIELHVPFHFVIVNSGKKLFELYGEDEIDFKSDFAFLDAPDQLMIAMLRNIYVAWLKASPDECWRNGNDSNNEQGNGDKQDVNDDKHDDNDDKHDNDDKNQDKTRELPTTPPTVKRGQGQVGPSRLPIRRGCTATELLGLWDSASCLSPSDGIDEINYNDDETEPLGPWDSASCFSPSDHIDEISDGDVETKPFVDDDDDEWEDPEFFDDLRRWTKCVWVATHSDSGSDSGMTLVNGSAVPSLCKALGATTPPTVPALCEATHY